MTPAEFLDALDAASEGLPSGPLRVVDGDIAWNVVDDEDCEIAEHMTNGWARHIAAHSPSVTAALRACARALVAAMQEADRSFDQTITDRTARMGAKALAALAAAGGGDA